MTIQDATVANMGKTKRHFAEYHFTECLDDAAAFDRLKTDAIGRIDLVPSANADKHAAVQVWMMKDNTCILLYTDVTYIRNEAVPVHKGLHFSSWPHYIAHMSDGWTTYDAPWGC